MRKENYTVHLFFGGEEPDAVMHTTDIDVARRWVNEAEHGLILNNQNIPVQ